MPTKLPSKLLFGVIALMAVAALGYRFHQRRQCATGVVINLNPTSADRTLTSLVDVGLDPNCLLGSSHGDTVLISIKVVPVIAENPNAAIYERVFRVSKKDIPNRGRLAEIPVPASEISAQIKTDWTNTIWSVGVCADKNGNQRCDEQGLVQALRLSGKHVQAMGLSNDSSITVSADLRNGQSCQM